MDTLLRYGLLAVLVALLLTPLGLPIPEDISLLTAGALVRTGHGTLPAAILVGFVGVLGGDSIAWSIGRGVGTHPTGRLSRLFGKRQTVRIRKFYDRFGPWTILICRQLPGLRFPAFFFAGATGMGYARFIAMDAAGACITIGLWVSVGWWFGPHIQEHLNTIGQIRWVLMGAGMVVVAVVIWRWRARRHLGDQPTGDGSEADDSVYRESSGQ